MGYRRCLWGHTDCKALWPIAQQQAEAATPVTNILKAMLGSSRHARAKHCEVSFQLWRLALTSRRMHCNAFCVFGKQAARASVASVVSALAGALPKMQSCHGAPAAAFLKSEGAVHAETGMVWAFSVQSFCQALRPCRPALLEVLMGTCAPQAQGSRWQKMWIGRTG